MDKRAFYAPDIDPSALAQALYDWFAGQSYQTQILPSQSGALTVQARKEDALRTIAGMSTALTVNIVSDGENLTVEMGAAKWTDKAIAGGVGLFLFAPALITAGIGAYQQSQLNSHAWKFIENYLQTQSAFGNRPANPVPPSVGSYPAPGSPASPYGGMPSANNTAPMGGGTGFPQSPQAFQPGGQPPARPAGSPPPINFAASQGAGVPTASSSAGVCSSCKQPLRPGAKFCDNCGAPAPVSNQCRSCGKALRPGAKFCDNCGTPVN